MFFAAHIPTSALISSQEAHVLFNEGHPAYQDKTAYECPFCGVAMSLTQTQTELHKLKFMRPYFSARYVGEKKHDEDCEALLRQVSQPRSNNSVQGSKIIFATRPARKDRSFSKTGTQTSLYQPDERGAATSSTSGKVSHPQLSLFKILKKPNKQIEKLRNYKNFWVRHKKHEILFSDFVRSSKDFDLTREFGMIYGIATLEHQPEKSAIRFKFKDRGNLRKPIMSSYRYTKEDLEDLEFVNIINDLPRYHTYEIAFLWWKHTELDYAHWLECENRNEVWLKWVES